MEISVRSIQDGSTVKSLQLAESVFSAEFNEGLVHQVMVSYQARARAGTKAQKSRADVSGGGKKPWKQKGTGRARAGTTRGPIWRGGGVTFAAKTRDYSKKVNTKMYRAAVRSVLGELQRTGRLVVLENLEIDSIKTAALKAKLQVFDGNTTYIIAEESAPRNFELSARNIPHIFVGDLSHLNFIALLQCDCIMITEVALKKLEEVLS